MVGFMVLNHFRSPLLSAHCCILNDFDNAPSNSNAYSSIIRVSQVGLNRPDEGRVKNSKRKL